MSIDWACEEQKQVRWLSMTPRKAVNHNLHMVSPRECSSESSRRYSVNMSGYGNPGDSSLVIIKIRVDVALG